MTSSSDDVLTRQDVVLVDFLFSEDTGSKPRRRPVLVLGSPEYHQGRQEAVVAAITSNTSRLLPGDHLMDDWERAGLLLPSVVTGIIRTIKQGMIGRKLGLVSEKDMDGIEVNLRSMLGPLD